MKFIANLWACAVLLCVGLATAQASECKATARLEKSWKANDGTALKFRIEGTWSQQSSGSTVYTAISSVVVTFHYRVTWTDARGQEHIDTRSGHTRYLLGGSGFDMQLRAGEFSTSATDKIPSNEPTMQITRVTIDDIRCDAKAL